MKHILKIAGKEVVLTTAQARELKRQLEEVFGSEQPVQWHPLPNVPSPFPQEVFPTCPIWKIPEIICGVQLQSGFSLH